MLHVQTAGAAAGQDHAGRERHPYYHSDEAAKVLTPIERFLKRHDLNFRTPLGGRARPRPKIVRVAKQEEVRT